MLIGIWGYGKVGKALANYYLETSTAKIFIMDQNHVNINELNKFNNRVFTCTENQKDFFFRESSIIFVSPGIDITNYYQTFKKKIFFELDLFYTLWKKWIIAITGSNGKTSITYFLHELLKKHNVAATIGGNIGIPTIELMKEKNTSACAVLEVSSFQLEYTKHFTPDFALITNLSENHLDRHKTMDAYFHAKYALIAHQQSHQKALIPLSLYSLVIQKKPKSQISVFCAYPNQKNYEDLILMSNHRHCFVMNKNKFLILSQGHVIKDFDLPEQKQTFDENILILLSALFLLGYNTEQTISYLKDLKPLEHRLEFVACKQGIYFYNDSKSTTMHSTIAAINQCNNKNIFLILGGLSKGVNRKPFFEIIKDKVSFISCFGKEAQELGLFCNAHSISHSTHEQLSDAFETIVKEAQKIKNSIILFSPAGSSYDLFNDYQERGRAFKNLVSCLLSK